MTIDASGWLDPRLAYPMGKISLDACYGVNHPNPTGPDYWRRKCTAAGRSFPRGSSNPQLISPGIAVNEWFPTRAVQVENWAVEGLRAGRAEAPEVFIAVWSAEPTPALLALGRDAIVDLFIVEGYTHTDNRNHTFAWERIVSWCDTFRSAGLIRKTIVCLGHITDEPDYRGNLLTTDGIAQQARSIRQRYAEMPGIAFYCKAMGADTPRQRELIAFCDRLSGDLWPSA